MLSQERIPWTLRMSNEYTFIAEKYYAANEVRVAWESHVVSLEGSWNCFYNDSFIFFFITEVMLHQTKEVTIIRTKSILLAECRWLGYPLSLVHTASYFICFARRLTIQFNKILGALRHTNGIQLQLVLRVMRDNYSKISHILHDDTWYGYVFTRNMPYHVTISQYVHKDSVACS